MRIGVLSDTHIPGRGRALPAQLMIDFAEVDLILHVGDVVHESVLVELRRLAPVEAVCGNNDPPELALALGTTKELLLCGLRIGLAHGHVGQGKSTVERALSHFHGANCVVFGHSHMPYLQQHGQTLCFNPGSPTDRRRSPTKSYGFLLIQDGLLRAEHRSL